MRFWIENIIKYRRLVVVATLLITAGLLIPLKSLQVIIDPDEALPQTHLYVKTNNEVEKIFHKKFSAIVAVHVRDGSVLETKNIQKIQRITERLQAIPGVVDDSVISLASPQAKVVMLTPLGPRPVTLLSIAENAKSGGLATAIRSAPAFQDLLVSKDEKTAQIVAEFKKVPAGFLSIDAAIRQAVETERDAETEIWIGGVPSFLSLLEKFSERMAFLFPLAILMIGLIHYEAFRTLQALFLPLVTALIAVVWSVGILGLSGQAIDVFNAATPILILAIAAGHAVQILKRYYEEFNSLRRENPGISAQEANQKAVFQSLVKVGPVMAAACIVAALGFFSLMIFEIKSIQIFGVFTGTGIISALILELTFIPALRSLLPPPGQKEYERESSISIWDNLIDFFYRFVQEKRKWLYFLFLISGLAMAYGATHVQIDNSQKSYFYGNLSERKQDDLINTNMAGTNTIFVLVDASKAGGILNLPVLSGIENIQHMFASESFIGKTLSIADLFKHIHLVMNGGKAGDYRLPDSEMELNMTAMALSAQGEDKYLNAFLDPGKNISLIQIFVKKDKTELIDGLAKKVLREGKNFFPPGVELMVGGSAAGGVALNEVMIREKILNILQIMAAVFIVSAIVFRSLIAGALILVPLFAAVLANFGVMGIFGIPLQIATALVSAMAVGIGADYGIYLSYRLREELAIAATSEQAAFRKAFFSAGKATLFVSVAVAGGFGILMLSYGFMVHLWMGLLIAISMLVSALTAITLFPALLLSLRPKFIYKNRR